MYLPFQVLNMTEYADYCGRVNAWEAERQRQRVEFSVTEDDLDADLRLPSSLSNYSEVQLLLYFNQLIIVCINIV